MMLLLAVAYNTLVVLTGVSLLGACAGVVGCFAVLRRRSLTGDALAHAALPGLCLAYLIVGQREREPMLFAALATGLLGIALIAALRRWTRVKEDAAIGVVLSFFGVGVVLLSVIQGLPGGARAGLQSYNLGQTAGLTREDVAFIGGLALLTVLVVLVLYKEFKLITFDQGFARVQGWPALRLDLALMGLIALVVVLGLPAVGVLLVAALLIVPAAAARFWTQRLWLMLMLSAGFGTVACFSGTVLSNDWDLPPGPCIVLVGAAIFLFSVAVPPHRGLVGRILARRRCQRDLAYGTLLNTLFDLSEPFLPVRPALPRDELAQRRSWPPATLQRLLRRGVVLGHVDVNHQGVMLTRAGLLEAAQVTQGRRLWAQFLQDHPESAQGMVSFDAASLDTLVPQAILAELQNRLRSAGRLPLALVGAEDKA